VFSLIDPGDEINQAKLRPRTKRENLLVAGLCTLGCTCYL